MTPSLNHTTADTPPHAYHAYVMSNDIGVVHVDVTDDLVAAVTRHKDDSDAHGFIARYDVRQLWYYESFSTLRAARRRAEALRALATHDLMKCIARLNTERACLYERVCAGERQPVLMRAPKETSRRRRPSREDERTVFPLPRTTTRWNE